VAALAETINNMTDTLATYARSGHNRRPRKSAWKVVLGGQANVPGRCRYVKDHHRNVNKHPSTPKSTPHCSPTN